MTHTADEIKDIKSSIRKYFKDHGYSTSVLFIYFKHFTEANYWDNALERCLEMRKNPGYTQKKAILMYGEDMGKRKWQEYCERQAYTNSQEYKGMSDDEFKAYNKSRAVTLGNLIKKHGVEEGAKIWDNYRKRQAYTNTLGYFQEKLGVLEGAKKYREVSDSKAHTLETYISRFGAEQGAVKFEEYIKSTHTGFFSKVASDLFETLSAKFPELDARYEPKTPEFGIMDTIYHRYYRYDFVIPEIKYCIEFNGDVFHANPDKFNAKDHPNPYTNESAQEIWDRDARKLAVIKERGFIVDVVWESHYNADKDGIIKKLTNRIKGIREVHHVS